jgi:hypothetical protein
MSAGNPATLAGKNPKKTKRILINVTLVVVTAAIIVAAILLVLDRDKPIVPAENPSQVLDSMFGLSDSIAEIDYDPALTFENYGDIAMAGGKELKPLENDLFRKGKDGENILFDESIVSRVIVFNSNWVDAQNGDSEDVLASVVKNSEAVDKLKEKGGTAQIAFHRMDIGAIAQDGKNYYILTRENYTMVANGESKPFEGVYAYKLVPKKDQLLIQDFATLNM